MVAPVLAAAVLASGLPGVATKGPTTPVCRDDVPCSAPAAGVTILFTHAGLRRGVTTDAHGRYRVVLPPGRYAVEIPRQRFGFQPRSVRVVTGRYRRVDFFLDTGIR